MQLADVEFTEEKIKMQKNKSRQNKVCESIAGREFLSITPRGIKDSIDK